MYQYLLFDLDGTLTDSQEGITKSVDYALRTVAGIETSDLSTLTPYIGPPLVEGFMQNHDLSFEIAVRCKDAYRERYADIGIFENRVYEGIPETLETLQKKGYTLALATSKPQPFAARILAHFSLTQYFSVICGATLDGRISQKSEVIAETLRQLSNPAREQTLMIGDRLHDVEGAAEHSVKTLGVCYGFGGADELQSAGALALVDTPQDIANWILNNSHS